jgi:hypothetical protein
MLIETPYKDGDTVSVKLSSGEELVARLDSEDDKHITLNKPMVLVANQQGLGLAPFMFSVSPDNKFKINIGNVTCVLRTEKGLSNQYTEQTTGIKLP